MALMTDIYAAFADYIPSFVKTTGDALVREITNAARMYIRRAKIDEDGFIIFEFLEAPTQSLGWISDRYELEIGSFMFIHSQNPFTFHDTPGRLGLTDCEICQDFWLILGAFLGGVKREALIILCRFENNNTFLRSMEEKLCVENPGEVFRGLFLDNSIIFDNKA
jgi:hypothetical protein